MRAGPQKTDLSKVGGFSIGGGRSAAGRGAPVAGRAPGTRPGPGVAALFGEAAAEEAGRSASSAAGRPSWSRPTAEALQAQRQAQELLAQDPSIFQYDEVLDDIKEEREQETRSQAIRTDVLQQKKRVGLTVPVGTAVATGTKREAKYIERVMVATDRRKVEQQIIEDRLLKKEKDARKDCEVFVTGAFKEELKRRQKFVEELEAKDFRDSLKAAEKQENGRGFADFNRALLNGGLASSRGLEKVRERAAAAAKAEAASEELKDELKEEVKDELLEATKEEALKSEDFEAGAAQPEYGVEDVAHEVAAKKAKIVEEPAAREEKTLSARERYLARKRAEAAEG